MSEPERLFRVIIGNRDVIESLEFALEEAKAGRLDGVVIAGISGERLGWHWAWRDDTPYPWPRLLAASSCATEELTRKGLR